MLQCLNGWNIEHPEHVAAFLGQVGHESNGLQVLEENLHYSALGLANTWPTRFSSTRAQPYNPNALALQLARNPEAIANNVYSNRMGNGDAASGDGWNFRGRGPKQITGRYNYTKLAEDTGLEVVQYPDLLLNPMEGSVSACWYWTTHNCGAFVDAGDDEGLTKAINGGLIGHGQRVRRIAVARVALGLA